MPVFAVQYTYDERTTERDATRAEHRTFLGALQAQGVLLASGPYGGPTASSGEPERSGGDATEADGALLIVRAGTAAAVGAVLDADPFAREGLISSRTVRPWTPVFGPWS